MPRLVRDDISDQLIHFTKPQAARPQRFLEESLAVFDSTLTERKLNGGTGFIRGLHPCICFTEAPIGKLPQIFANPDRDLVRYSPYGFMFTKRWIYEKGGRPVIYGPA